MGIMMRRDFIPTVTVGVILAGKKKDPMLRKGDVLSVSFAESIPTDKIIGTLEMTANGSTSSYQITSAKLTGLAKAYGVTEWV